MRIKLKANMAGPDGAHQAGAHLTVDEKEGRELVKGGYAVEVPPKKSAVQEGDPAAPAAPKSFPAKPGAKGAPAK